MKAYSVDGKLHDPGYFRVTPYTSSSADRASFSRPDHLGGRVLEWLRSSQDGTLYLSGKSGTGKSSILSAHVLPELAEKYTVVSVRTTFEPQSSLREALTRPGAVYAKPPKDLHQLDSAALTSRVAEYASSNKKPLLVVFDQFEEFLIARSLRQSDPEATAPPPGSPECDVAEADFVRFLCKFDSSDAAEKAAHILLVVRSDYLGHLEELGREDYGGLPTLKQRQNWYEVPPFTRSGAREFLVGGGLKLGSDIVDRALAHAEAVEDTKNLIRPITLNIIGEFLRAASSMERAVLSQREMGTILRDYILRGVGSAEDSWNLLTEMITPAGSKRPPQALEALANATDLPRDVAKGALLHLANSGIVRRVDHASDHWEVSHDFLARLIERYAPNRRPEPLLTASRGVVFGVTGLWLVLASVAYLQWRHGQDSALIAEIQAKELANVLEADNGHVLKFVEGWDGHYSREEADQRAREVVALANDFQRTPVVATAIQGDVAHPSVYDSLSGLRSLRSLTLDQVSSDLDLYQLLIELDLYHLRVRLKDAGSISSGLLARHRSLRSLSLWSVRLEQPHKLEALEELRCVQLRDVSVDPTSLTRYWPKLEEISVAGSDVVTLAPLAHLTELRRLGIPSTNVDDLSPIARLPLEYLNVSNSKVSELSTIGELQRLELLNISRLHSMEALDLSELGELPELRVLMLGRNALREVGTLSKFTNLEFVDFRGAQLEDHEDLLGVLRSLKRLKVVRLPVDPEIDLEECRTNLSEVDCIASDAPFDYADRWREIATSVCASYDPSR